MELSDKRVYVQDESSMFACQSFSTCRPLYSKQISQMNLFDHEWNCMCTFLLEALPVSLVVSTKLLEKRSAPVLVTVDKTCLLVLPTVTWTRALFYVKRGHCSMFTGAPCLQCMGVWVLRAI